MRPGFVTALHFPRQAINGQIPISLKECGRSNFQRIQSLAVGNPYGEGQR